MGLFTASIPVRKQTVEAVVIRADGTVENIGVVAYWHRSRLMRALWRIRQFWRGRRAGVITRHRTLKD